jgi:hypothetical protein
MSDQDQGNTEFILPIVCPHCKNHIDLAMVFALMAPEVKPVAKVEDVEPAEEEDEEEDDDEQDDDIPETNNA